MAENMMFSKTTEGGRPMGTNQSDDNFDVDMNVLNLPEAYNGANGNAGQPSSISQVGRIAQYAVQDATAVSQPVGIERSAEIRAMNKAKLLDKKKEILRNFAKTYGHEIHESLNFLDSILPSPNSFQEFTGINSTFQDAPSSLNFLPGASMGAMMGGVREDSQEDVQDVNKVDINMKSFVEPSIAPHPSSTYKAGSDKIGKVETDAVLQAIDMLESEPKMLKPNKWNLMVE